MPYSVFVLDFVAAIFFDVANARARQHNIAVYNEEITNNVLWYRRDEVLDENTDRSLTLLFAQGSANESHVQNNERAFFEYISGHKIEYHDTFRNRYVSLLLLNKPEVVGEVLYGGSRYREVKYTFKNIYGRSFATSKIY